MKISQKGIELIKRLEGCKLVVYKCQGGKLSIGYGHTAGVQQGQTITQAQADKFFLEDIVRFENCVNKYAKYNWTQNEFDALVSFAYNIGSIDQLTANGTRTKQQIAEAMLLYNKAAGSVSQGLVKRRTEEQQIYLSGKGDEQNSKSTIVKYSLKRDGNIKLSENFTIKEFACKDGSDEILVDVDFVKDKLQSIRNHFGVPVTINSAYRTESYNKKVGGAAKSNHMTGQAFDIVVKGKTPLEVAKCAQNLCVHGIIQYNTFVHVDGRSTKYWARDDNGKVTVRSGF